MLVGSAITGAAPAFARSKPTTREERFSGVVPEAAAGAMIVAARAGITISPAHA
jgi:hypothetical protein